jgi:HEAT repeat protein
MADPNALVSSDALRALWSEGAWQTRRAAVWRLAGRADRELVGSVLLALRDGHRDFGIVSSALSLLALSDVDIAGPLIEFLRDPDSSLRLQAAVLLGERSEPRATSALLEALGDSDSNVRFHVIEALGRLRAADAVDALMTIAESGDLYLAFAAIDALGKIGERRIARRLVPLLAEPMLRTPVADALGVVGDASIVPSLVRLLGEPDTPTDAVVAGAERPLHERRGDRRSAGGRGERPRGRHPDSARRCCSMPLAKRTSIPRRSRPCWRGSTGPRWPRSDASAR